LSQNRTAGFRWHPGSPRLLLTAGRNISRTCSRNNICWDLVRAEL
jgi:hypothetical protein